MSLGFNRFGRPLPPSERPESSCLAVDEFVDHVYVPDHLWHRETPPGRIGLSRNELGSTLPELSWVLNLKLRRRVVGRPRWAHGDTPNSYRRVRIRPLANDAHRRVRLLPRIGQHESNSSIAENLVGRAVDGSACDPQALLLGSVVSNLVAYYQSRYRTEEGESERGPPVTREPEADETEHYDDPPAAEESPFSWASFPFAPAAEEELHDVETGGQEKEPLLQDFSPVSSGSAKHARTLIPPPPQAEIRPSCAASGPFCAGLACCAKPVRESESPSEWAFARSRGQPGAHQPALLRGCERIGNRLSG